MIMKETKKVFRELAISTDGLHRIEMLVEEIHRLQANIRTCVLDEITRIEDEADLTNKEKKKIETALKSDLALTGADVVLNNEIEEWNDNKGRKIYRKFPNELEEYRFNDCYNKERFIFYKFTDGNCTMFRYDEKGNLIEIKEILQCGSSAVVL